LLGHCRLFLAFFVLLTLLWDATHSLFTVNLSSTNRLRTNTTKLGRLMRKPASCRSALFKSWRHPNAGITTQLAGRRGSCQLSTAGCSPWAKQSKALR
jgi:hypothetical protein